MIKLYYNEKIACDYGVISLLESWHVLNSPNFSINELNVPNVACIRQAGRWTDRQTDRQTNLYSDIQPGDVEGFKHDLSCVLSVLWSVERWLRL